MTDEKKPADPKAAADDKADSAHKITRRRFTKAGVAAPLIMTLASRPVWGQSCTESALGSMTHASHAGTDGQGEVCMFGCGPAGWLERDTNFWPIQSITPFKSEISVTATADCLAGEIAGVIDDSTTLFQVLDLNVDELPDASSPALIAFVSAAQEAVAAILNIAAVELLADCTFPDVSVAAYKFDRNTVVVNFAIALSSVTDCGSGGAFTDFLAEMRSAHEGATCPIPYIDCTVSTEISGTTEEVVTERESRRALPDPPGRRNR